MPDEVRDILGIAFIIFIAWIGSKWAIWHDRRKMWDYHRRDKD